VWTGASCFIELGTIVPRNGGMQEYLRAGYGDFVEFLFSCVWLSIVRPCSMAMIAMIFAEHVNGIVGFLVVKLLIISSIVRAVIVGGIRERGGYLVGDEGRAAGNEDD
jgi:amino acid transporter